MSKPVRILLVEDSERDAALMLLYLRRGGYEPVLKRVETSIDMKAALAASPWDVIVSDFNLPGFDAYAAIEVLRASGLPIPLIVVSGEINEEIIQGVQKAGATQYLCKYEMRQIAPTIEKAIQSRPGASAG
jgi:phosphoserine phosphatase RsbU/P